MQYNKKTDAMTVSSCNALERFQFRLPLTMRFAGDYMIVCYNTFRNLIFFVCLKVEMQIRYLQWYRLELFMRLIAVAMPRPYDIKSS